MRHLTHDHEGGTTMGHQHHDHEGDRAMSHHDHHSHAEAARDISDSFSRDTSGLAIATSPETVNLRDGDVFDLHIHPVRKRIAGTEVRMLRYNGSIPARHCASTRARRSP